MDDSKQHNPYSDKPQQFYAMFGIGSNAGPNEQHQSVGYPPDDGYNNIFGLGQAQLPYDRNVYGPPTSPPARAFSNPAFASLESSDHAQPYLPSSVDGTPTVESGQVRSSSEEKDANAPASSKRKEQNRAAQRAFRERKERHVKELEQRLTTLEENYSVSQTDNERLKRELAKVATERDILRATASPSHPLHGLANDHPVEEEPLRTGPLQYVPTDSYRLANSKGVPQRSQHLGKLSAPHRMAEDPVTGERLLTSGELWDVIQEHELTKQGLVDIGQVCERLKNKARCTGQGPAFMEADVVAAISESASGGKNELI